MRLVPTHTVQVEQGVLSGVRSADGAVTAYKGIPYAAPPLGTLRWRAPRPAPRWEGIRRADTFASAAMQPPVLDPIAGGDHGYGEPSEDCLYLNVWSAADGPGEQRPVMVWFHHGAFRYGGTGVPAYDGEGLARAGAVVVTVAYRLGRIGFLAHPELGDESGRDSSSNYGLLDQIAALKWVQANIAAFGGDPDCVTVFGLSAGSASVNVLMASPLAAGLFHRAIGESGALMAPAARSVGRADLVQHLRGAEETGLALMRELGCTSIDEMRSLPARDILAVSPLKVLAEPPTQPTAWTRDGAPAHRGMLDLSYPVIDGYVLPRTPYEIFAAGNQADIPLLCGSGAREYSGLPYITDLAGWERESRAEFGDFAPRFLELFAATQDDVREVSGASIGDRVFVWQNWTWMRMHARQASTNCFYYHWSYAPPAQVEAKLADKVTGGFHGAELPYTFRNLRAQPWPFSDFDRQLSDVVSTYWLNFARTGDPNGAGLPPWPAFDPSRPLAMHFAERIAAGEVPRRAQMDFWDDWYGAMRAGATTDAHDTTTSTGTPTPSVSPGAAST